MLKKITLALAVLAVSAGLSFAQDLETATNTYNFGAENLQLGDKAAALEAFQKALTMGEALGESGADIVENCKKAIPGVILSIGKELFNQKKFAEAAVKFSEAEAKAVEYGETEVAEEAVELVKQAGIQADFVAANAAFAQKKFADAAEGFKKVIAADSTNKNASVRLVQSLANIGELDEAKAALAIAEANGQGANAVKAIGGAYLKKAAAELKAGKAAEAIQLIEDGSEYISDAKAYQIAGTAATKLKKNDDAIKYFSKYLEMAPTASNAGQIALTVGALYQAKNEKAKAIEYYEIAKAAGVPDVQQYIDACKK